LKFGNKLNCFQLSISVWKFPFSKEDTKKIQKNREDKLTENMLQIYVKKLNNM
jgi:hypothetical protein